MCRHSEDEVRRNPPKDLIQGFIPDSDARPEEVSGAEQTCHNGRAETAVFRVFSFFLEFISAFRSFWMYSSTCQLGREVGPCKVREWVVASVHFLTFPKMDRGSYGKTNQLKTHRINSSTE